MNKICTIFIGLYLSVVLKAQINLVPNGNFEDTTLCGDTQSKAIFAVKNWFVPQNDVVNTDNPCAYIDWWRFLKYKKIGLNNSISGFIETYYRGFPDDNIYSGRRYLAVKLKQPLTAGQQYYFEMYTRAVDTFPNNQLVNTLFTIGQDVAFVKDFPTFDFDVPRNFLELRPTFRNTFYKDYDWHKVQGCFNAYGGEQYMIIGNFRNDANTETVSTGKRNPNFPNGLTSYYAIDNVVLTPMNLELRDTALCAGEILTLNVLKTIPDSVSYKWHTGATTPQYQSSKSENINITIQYPGQCFLSKSIKFTVVTSDYQPIARDTVLCVGTPITFTAGVGLKGETIRWQNGSKERNFTTSTEGVFTAHVESQCARWTDSFRIQTQDCGNGLYVPNAFSPNEDGVNDVFKPFFKSDFALIESYDFSVFNRWGNLVFKTTNAEEAWNGTWQDKKLPTDVYIWMINIQYKYNDKSKRLQKSGDILLMR